MSIIFKVILVFWLKVCRKKKSLAMQRWDFQEMDFYSGPIGQKWYWRAKTQSAQLCLWCIFYWINLTDFCQYISLSQNSATHIYTQNAVFFSLLLTLPLFLPCIAWAFFSELKLKTGTLTHVAQIIPNYCTLLC